MVELRIKLGEDEVRAVKEHLNTMITKYDIKYPPRSSPAVFMPNTIITAITISLTT